MTELVLIGLLLGTNVYWSWQTHKLLNKLMSRNYFEYNQSQLKESKKEGKLRDEEPRFIAPDDPMMGSVSEIM